MAINYGKGKNDSDYDLEDYHGGRDERIQRCQIVTMLV
jgi:hypothetical protein